MSLSEAVSMRVVGYVREESGPDGGESSYAQSERIRRWAVRGGHALVAVCQDVLHPGHALGRDGYRALIGIVQSGQADVVILPTLAVLAADKILQEIMLWDLRGRGVSVLVTDEDGLADLAEPPEDPVRMLIRDVLARMAEYGEALAEPEEHAAVVDLARPEVVIELLPANDQASAS
jgi:hypothetical protein